MSERFEDDESISDRDLRVAFICVSAAGLASCVGASIVFFPCIVTRTNNAFFAIVSGLVAGVMLYISMVDILGKSVGAFADSGVEEGLEVIYGTLCFFGGIVVGWLFKVVANAIMGADVADALEFFDIDAMKAANNNNMDVDDTHMAMNKDSKDDDEEEEEVEDDTADGRVGKLVNKLKSESKEDDEVENGKEESKYAGLSEEERLELQQKRNNALKSMGVEVALAMGGHNFPEGLLTFVGFLADTKIGFILCLAIGLHNIPEGMAVSVPIYYATGSRCQGFLWAFVAGITEPLGAVFGYYALGRNAKDEVYGILFGLVAGIMAWISIDAELPLAYRYDPENKYVMWSAVAGMAAVGGSLALFGLAEI